MRTNDIPSVLLLDGYKIGHPFQYPAGTEMVYSNMTPRSNHYRNSKDGVIFAGLQGAIQEYLVDHFQEHFFNQKKEAVLAYYTRRVKNYLGAAIPVDHIAALHDLGYLPIEIKALPEGMLVPYGVPALTIKSTHKDFAWVVNMLETLLSACLWQPSTSATTAREFRKNFEHYATITGSPKELIQFQGHDFSFRGMGSPGSAVTSGFGHLIFFSGTDTVPAIDYAEAFYGANSDQEMVGVSVPATEHAVMCLGDAAEGELETFRRLITQTYPGGIVSIVSDTWDLWKVLTDYIPTLKNEILARDGKVVIRPDSGDPVKIICGDPSAPEGSPQRAGVVELLWQTFGGTITSTGHKLLDSHIGAIYGDSINLERQVAILAALERNGFASANVVLGIGSFTYQYNTRDTDGWAMKATAAVLADKGLVSIFKKPVTDGGGKNSAKGLLRVDKVDGKLTLKQECTFEEEAGGELKTVFLNGKVFNFQSLADIRKLAATSI